MLRRPRRVVRRLRRLAGDVARRPGPRRARRRSLDRGIESRGESRPRPRRPVWEGASLATLPTFSAAKASRPGRRGAAAMGRRPDGPRRRSSRPKKYAGRRPPGAARAAPNCLERPFRPLGFLAIDGPDRSRSRRSKARWAARGRGERSAHRGGAARGAEGLRNPSTKSVQDRCRIG